MLGGYGGEKQCVSPAKRLRPRRSDRCLSSDNASQKRTSSSEQAQLTEKKVTRGLNWREAELRGEDSGKVSGPEKLLTEAEAMYTALMKELLSPEGKAANEEKAWPPPHSHALRQHRVQEPGEGGGREQRCGGHHLVAAAPRRHT